MNGIIIINKEKNYTSNDVVKKVKKILNEKVGHTGTLDPNATGVLPLLLGKGTKLSKYLINHDKEYEAIIQLGIKTTTADEEGEIIEKVDVKDESLFEENIKKSLNYFLGKIDQVPPIYSAIKVNGKKLYQYARNNEEVIIKPRKIEIYGIKLLDIDKEQKTLRFYVKCSKGTYIRTLCEDIAKQLNTIGYMKELKRLSVGSFNINDSVTIDELEANVSKNDYSNIITIEDFFRDKDKINFEKEADFYKYLNGVEITDNNLQDEIYRIYYQNKFVGVGIVKNNKLKRDVVIDF